MRAYSSARTRSTSSVIPASSDLRISPRASIQLDAVAVERNVAPAHHHPRAPRRDRVEEERRRRDRPGVVDAAPHVRDRPDARAHDAIGARAQVPGQDDDVSRPDLAAGDEVPERPFDVDVRLEVGDVLHEAAEAARPERERDGGVIEERGGGGTGAHGPRTIPRLSRVRQRRARPAWPVRATRPPRICPPRGRLG